MLSMNLFRDFKSFPRLPFSYEISCLWPCLSSIFGLCCSIQIFLSCFFSCSMALLSVFIVSVFYSMSTANVNYYFKNVQHFSLHQVEHFTKTWLEEGPLLINSIDEFFTYHVGNEIESDHFPPDFSVNTSLVEIDRSIRFIYAIHQSSFGHDSTRVAVGMKHGSGFGVNPINNVDFALFVRDDDKARICCEGMNSSYVPGPLYFRPINKDFTISSTQIPVLPSFDHRQREWYSSPASISGRNSTKLFWENWVGSKVAQTVSRNFYDKNGVFLGVISVFLTQDDYGVFFSGMDLEPEIIFLIDQTDEGLLLASSSPLTAVIDEATGLRYTAVECNHTVIRDATNYLIQHHSETNTITDIKGIDVSEFESDGEEWKIIAKPVEIKGGLQILIVLITKTEDVFGLIHYADRFTLILCVSCVLFSIVFFLLVIFCVIPLPLFILAFNMKKVEKMNFDKVFIILSCFHEIRLLQYRFTQCLVILDEVKPFVPEHILHSNNNYLESPEIEDTEDEDDDEKEQGEEDENENEAERNPGFLNDSMTNDEHNFMKSLEDQSSNLSNSDDNSSTCSSNFSNTSSHGSSFNSSNMSSLSSDGIMARYSRKVRKRRRWQRSFWKVKVLSIVIHISNWKSVFTKDPIMFGKQYSQILEFVTKRLSKGSVYSFQMNRIIMFYLSVRQNRPLFEDPDRHDEKMERNENELFIDGLKKLEKLVIDFKRRKKKNGKSAKKKYSRKETYMYCHPFDIIISSTIEDSVHGIVGTDGKKTDILCDGGVEKAIFMVDQYIKNKNLEKEIHKKVSEKLADLKNIKKKKKQKQNKMYCDDDDDRRVTVLVDDVIEKRIRRAKRNRSSRRTSEFRNIFMRPYNVYLYHLGVESHSTLRMGRMFCHENYAFLAVFEMFVVDYSLISNNELVLTSSSAKNRNIISIEEEIYSDLHFRKSLRLFNRGFVCLIEEKLKKAKELLIKSKSLSSRSSNRGLGGKRNGCNLLREYFSLTLEEEDEEEITIQQQQEEEEEGEEQQEEEEEGEEQQEEEGEGEEQEPSGMNLSKEERIELLMENSFTSLGAGKLLRIIERIVDHKEYGSFDEMLEANAKQMEEENILFLEEDRSLIDSKDSKIETLFF